MVVAGITVLLIRFISIEQYRSTVGLYYGHIRHHSCLHSKQRSQFQIFPRFITKNTSFSLVYLLSIVTLLCSLILLCGDVHTNPGPESPETRKHKQFSLCHVNIRSLNLRLASVETKLAPLYDVITLSETLRDPLNTIY